MVFPVNLDSQGDRASFVKIRKKDLLWVQSEDCTLASQQGSQKKRILEKDCGPQ